MQIKIVVVIVAAIAFENCYSLPLESGEDGGISFELQDDNGTAVAKLDKVSTGEEFKITVQSQIQDLLKEALLLSQQYENQLKEFFEENVQSFGSFLTEAIATIQTRFSEIKNNSIIIRDIESYLISVNEQVSRLADNLAKAKNQIAKNILETEINIRDEWYKFVGEELDLVAKHTDADDDILSKVEQWTDELINRYSNYIKSCSSEYEDSIDGFSDEVDFLILKNQEATKSVMEKLEACSKQEDDKKTSLECRSKLRKLLAALKSSPNHFEDINTDIAEIVSSGLQGRSCTIQTLLEFKMESEKIHHNAQNLIDEYVNKLQSA